MAWGKSSGRLQRGGRQIDGRTHGGMSNMPFVCVPSAGSSDPLKGYSEAASYLWGTLAAPIPPSGLEETLLGRYPALSDSSSEPPLPRRCCPRVPCRPLQFTRHVPAFFTRTGLPPACSCELISPQVTVDSGSPGDSCVVNSGSRSCRSPCMLSGCGQFSPALINSVALSKEVWQCRLPVRLSL